MNQPNQTRMFRTKKREKLTTRLQPDCGIIIAGFSGAEGAESQSLTITRETSAKHFTCVSISNKNTLENDISVYKSQILTAEGFQF